MLTNLTHGLILSFSLALIVCLYLGFLTVTAFHNSFFILLILHLLSQGAEVDSVKLKTNLKLDQ